MIGQTLLHYRVLSKLGEGGMGEVYLAQDTKLERNVALKVLPEEMARNPRRWERFVREAKAVAALNHPNIVTIYAVEEAAGRHFFAMELVEGQTLDRLIPRDGMELPRFFDLAGQLTAALGGAHRQGILHRDLKPQNVMVTREGRVKVLDFGVAKAVRQQQKTEAGGGVARKDLTDEGAVLGTASYMSPEQACAEPVDRRSDLFSLGIILFEMATGGYPFHGRTPVAVLSSILRDEPPLAGALRRGLPSRLSTAINRCLQKTPDLRYPTAEALAQDLETAHTQWRQAPVVDGPEPTVEGPRAAARAGERTPSGPRPGSRTSLSTPALAVLPLVDLAGEPNYFVEGLTEELITAVAKVGSLRVISRQSVMRYRGSDKLLPEIARELGVDHVLEGSVLRAGDRVRISLQLIRADPEQHLWAERYERGVGDVLTVQSEVARAVAMEIRGRLTSSDEVKLVPPRPVAPEVVEAYLKGRHFLNKRTQESLEKALTCFEEAIEGDRLHAPSYAGLADALALIGQRRPAPQIARRAASAARTALELDPGLAEAHTSLGWISYFFERNWESAEAEFRRALELSPNQADAHHWYWSLLIAVGRRDEAAQEIRRAVQLDPVAPIIVTNVGVHHYVCRELERAVAQLRKALELEPGFPWANLALWRVYERLGSKDAAMEALSHGLRGLGFAEVASHLGVDYPRLGYGPVSEAVADELMRLGPAPLPLDAVAWLYLANGLSEKALALLEDAFENDAPLIPWLAAAPDWDPLRGEGRFRDLVSRLGLPNP
jgi:serine/threonine-protein kinase